MFPNPHWYSHPQPTTEALGSQRGAWGCQHQFCGWCQFDSRLQMSFLRLEGMCTPPLAPKVQPCPRACPIKKRAEWLLASLLSSPGAAIQVFCRLTSSALLPSSPNLAGAELAPTSLASTSWPEPKEAILSGAVAGSHYLRWSGDLLPTTSYSREHKCNKPA